MRNKAAVSVFYQNQWRLRTRLGHGFWRVGNLPMLKAIYGRPHKSFDTLAVQIMWQRHKRWAGNKTMHRYWQRMGR